MMYNQRTNPLYQKLRRIGSSGELGEVRRTNWIITNWYRSQSYYDSGGWRATWAGEGGGVLINQDPHQLDLWHWTTGLMPKRLRAFCYFGKYRNIEVEDDVTALWNMRMAPRAFLLRQQVKPQERTDSRFAVTREDCH